MDIDKRLALILTSLATLFLFSCASDTDVNKENFTKAINAHLHKQEICFEDKIFAFPREISSKEKLGEGLIVKYDALAAAGLVSRKMSSKQIKGPGLKMTFGSATVYDLTATGFRHSKKLKTSGNKKYRRFCFANPHASSVKHFSAPANKEGKTTTEVVFKYSLTNVAKWARQKKLLDTFPQVKREIDKLDSPTEQKATLVLTKEKWIYKK